MPCNISKKLSEQAHVKFHDLDSISVELEETKEHRIAATSEVNSIIHEEIESYIDWLEGAALRAFLAEFKIKINEKVKTQLDTNIEDSKIKLVANQVMRKLMAQNQISIAINDIDSLILDEISLLKI